jgi:hypothetical protein
MSPKPKLICPQCGIGPFTIRSAYDLHVAGCTPDDSSAPAAPAASTDEVPADLTCRVCDAGPYTSIKGYKAHVRGHEKIECSDCGRPCAGPGGLAKHRSHAHGAASTTAVERAAKRERAIKRRRTQAAAEAQKRLVLALPEALAHLLPESPLIDRLAAFVAQHSPDDSLWVVATATSGPWLCRVAQIGIVAQREHVPVVAVHVADIHHHLNQLQADGPERATA